MTWNQFLILCSLSQILKKEPNPSFQCLLWLQFCKWKWKTVHGCNYKNLFFFIGTASWQQRDFSCQLQHVAGIDFTLCVCVSSHQNVFEWLVNRVPTILVINRLLKSFIWQKTPVQASQHWRELFLLSFSLLQMYYFGVFMISGQT